MLTRQTFKMFPAIALLALFATACGNSYRTVKVKNYRLAVVEGGDSKVNETIKTLIAEYNNLAGMQVLTYVDNPGDANSTITVTKNLESSGHTFNGEQKVGQGQWLSETKTDGPLSNVGGSGKQTITYSMRVEFDYDFLTTRAHYDLQKLFFHEVGHGLEMNHNVASVHSGQDDCSAAHSTQDERNVMFCSVDGDKDFSPYFDQVRQYMSDT